MSATEPAVLRHDDDPSACRACVVEGRALFDSEQYTEAEPHGPRDYADYASPETQTTTAYGRRFHKSRYDGTYAVIDVVFVGERQGCDATARTWTTRSTTYTICRDLADIGGTELYSNEISEELTEETGPPTDAQMLELCGNFDPAALAWNGAPRGELPCEPYVQGEAHRPGTNRYLPPMRVCATHPGTHGLMIGARETTVENFACDRNMHWLFVLEYHDPHADDPADMTVSISVDNLTSVRAAVRSNVQNREYEPASALRIYRYLGAGQLQPLTWRAVPHRNADWHRVDDDDRMPVIADALYEVVGPHPQGSGRLMRYTAVGLMLHGDS